MLLQFESKVVHLSDNATQTKNNGEHGRNKENPKN